MKKIIKVNMTNFLVTYAVNGIDASGNTYNTVVALVKTLDDPELVEKHCKGKKVDVTKLSLFDYIDYCNYAAHPNQFNKFTALMAEII